MRTLFRGPHSRLRWLALLAGSLVLLAAAVSAGVGVVGAAMGGTIAASSTPPPGKFSTVPILTPITGHKGHATCDEPGQPACPPLPNFWMPIASDSPAAVLAALPSLPGYATPPQVLQIPANAPYSFDTPVLVLPATFDDPAKQGGGEGDNLPHFVIRASVNLIRMVTYDATYDPATRQLGDLTYGGDEPGSPSYNKPFPWVGVAAGAAAATLRSARGIGPESGTRPQLVFFALNPNAMNPIYHIQWSGGGESPGDPIWRLKGSDGQLYFVGTDGRLYLPKDLPIAPGAVFTQP